MSNGPTAGSNKVGQIKVCDWFDAQDDESLNLSQPDWRVRRLQRLHAVQVALDVVAHAHNVPLRLLRWEKLRHLDKAFVEFVEKWKGDILGLMTERAPDGVGRVPLVLSDTDAKALIRQMLVPDHVRTLCQWTLHQAGVKGVQSVEFSKLPDHYAEWFLMLLPHLEREVWLTDMSNPLPAHNLARMVEHWALFVLMWGWHKAEEIEKSFSEEPSIFHSPEALEVEHLRLLMQPAFDRKGRLGSNPEQIVLLVGPYVDGDSFHKGDDKGDGGARFHKKFRHYLAAVASAGIPGWDEVQEKAPDADELADAMEARVPLSEAEARQRAAQCQHAWRTLLAACMDADLHHWQSGKVGRPLSRANWETMAVMACWKARWENTLAQRLADQPVARLHMCLPRHRVHGVIEVNQHLPLRFSTDRDPLPPDSLDSVLSQIPPETGAPIWIDSLVNLHARVRERQQAGWSAYISAINHLLARHSRRDRPEGADDPSALNKAPASCEEVDHLLRGFGARICRYLLGMARADTVELYWKDYSNLPPRLRHVGSAERLIQHRSTRQNIWTRFNNDIWNSRSDGQPAAVCDGVDLGPQSRYQVYRVARHGHIEPTKADRKAKASEKTSGPVAATDLYKDTIRPEDCVSVPLIFNNRVVGVLFMFGIASSRHFDTRLYPWLRLLAQDLGQAMYHHCQIWQMRQINWLASNVPLEKWDVSTFADESHPLLGVSRCLANIFLASGIQIWLPEKQNPQRYLLAATTVPQLYRDHDGAVPDHAPHVVLNPGLDVEKPPLTRPIFAFALDAWLRRSERASSADARGLFVQARFDATRNETKAYNHQSAENGTLVLGRDFIEARAVEAAADDNEALPAMRRILFQEHGWADWMGFALINGDGDPVGIVSLHATPLNRSVAGVDSDGNPQKGRPPGWRPVVAHMQTYLPYVLTQTETIDKPLSQLVQYLLHQGRNEFNATSIRASNTREMLTGLLFIDPPQGKVRPWLSQRRTTFGHVDDQLMRHLDQLENLLDGLAIAINNQTSVDNAESLVVMGRLIEQRRSIAQLGHDLSLHANVHRTEWLDFKRSLDNSLEPFAKDMKRAGIFVTIARDIDGWQMHTQPRLWSWILLDLMHNVAKYAAENGRCQISLNAENLAGQSTMRLTLVNEAAYQASVDAESKLVQYGYRGSAGLLKPSQRDKRPELSRSGTGIGLWGVNQLALTLGLTFSIAIKPVEKRPGIGTYTFSLYIPNKWMRREGRV